MFFLNYTILVRCRKSVTVRNLEKNTAEYYTKIFNKYVFGTCICSALSKFFTFDLKEY